ncbi:MAG: hypothetical protein RIS70_2144 [Planctomycetota bacterium]
MLLLISALTMGLIFALLALGIYISYHVFHFPDITADGSFTFGAAVTTAMLVRGWGPLAATLGGFLAGMLAGVTTGTLHARFQINGLLSGILVTTALYSIDLHVMGRSNVSLSDFPTLTKQWTAMAKAVAGQTERLNIAGWLVGIQDIAVLGSIFALVMFVSVLLFCFLQTNFGSAMRGAGDNAQMIRALGVSDKFLLIFGLALANGLVALSGSLLAQYQEFADVQMGIGMVVWGLASVIIGESLVGTARYGLLIAGAVLGSVLFRLMIAIALRWGLNPNDLKLITAVFVFAALVAPTWIRKWKASISAPKPAATNDA